MKASASARALSASARALAWVSVVVRVQSTTTSNVRSMNTPSFNNKRGRILNSNAPESTGSCQPGENLFLYRRIIQQIEVVHAVQDATVVRLDVQAFQIIAMLAGGAAESYQQISHHQRTQIRHVFADCRCQKVVLGVVGQRYCLT